MGSASIKLNNGTKITDGRTKAFIFIGVIGMKIRLLLILLAESRQTSAPTEKGKNDMRVKKKITKEDIKRFIEDLEYLKRFLGE